jgi:hypothetical protein
MGVIPSKLSQIKESLTLAGPSFQVVKLQLDAYSSPCASRAAAGGIVRDCRGDQRIYV